MSTQPRKRLHVRTLGLHAFRIRKNLIIRHYRMPNEIFEALINCVGAKAELLTARSNQFASHNNLISLVVIFV